MADAAPPILPPLPGPEVPGSLDQAVERLKHLEAAYQRSEETLTRTQVQLFCIYNSNGWKLLDRLYKVRNRLLPPGSLRYRMVVGLLHSLLRFAKRLARTHAQHAHLSNDDEYLTWIRQNEPRPAELASQRRVRFAHEPCLSLLLSLGETGPAHVEAMLRSVLDQTYCHWELRIADMSGTGLASHDVFREIVAGDPRVHVEPCLGGMADGWNAALARATGDYVAVLHPADLLAPSALHEIVRTLNEIGRAEILYTDEDRIDQNGNRRSGPAFKPDWSPDTLRSCNYIGNLTLFSRQLIEQVGGFRPELAGAEQYDLLLRASEQARQIVHIPRILYHARIASAVQGADENARKALAAHVARLGVAADVTGGLRPGTHRVRYQQKREPLVSIIIPNKDEAQTLANAVDSIRRSTYANHEIIIAENHSADPATFACYERLERFANLRVVNWTQPFNYAAINNFAASHARGEMFLFLNNDVEVITLDWMERLLEHALRPEVGAVGAKLYYPDRTIQHAGVIVGLCDAAGHSHRYFPGDAAGYMNRLVITQNFSAVTAACLMTRREVFDQVAGFDEKYVLAFNDVDLCLKIREQGYLIVWTPHAELYHHESKTRGYDVTAYKQARLLRETHFFQARWPGYLRARDPYYNPNLTWEWENFSLRLNTAQPGPVSAAIA